MTIAGESRQWSYPISKAVAVVVVFFIIQLCMGEGLEDHSPAVVSQQLSRKLFRGKEIEGGKKGQSVASAAKGTEREGEECSVDDIVIHQQQTAPLPNGIPTYTVNILNMCQVPGGCSMQHIHLNCGWFSSYHVVNPRLFRRLGYNDCLLNNGQPFAPGSSISFQYSDTYSYPLSVSSATCSSTSHSHSLPKRY